MKYAQEFGFSLHTIYFSSFQNGEESAFSLSLLKQILLRHDCKIDAPLDNGFIPVFCPVKDGEEAIGSDEGGIAVESSEAIEFSIGRPLYDGPMRQLAFELLDKLNLCAHGDGDRVYSARSLEAADIPEDILEDAERGISIVTSSTELWP